MTRTLFLARHGSHAEVGQVLSGRSDIGLSKDGRAQAAWLAERLRGVTLDAVYSSPRRRTLETATIAVAGRDLSIGIDEGLDEIDFGAWSGRSFADLEAEPSWRHWNAARGTAKTPAGDSMALAVAGARACIERVAVQAAVLCVSHCDIIRGIVAHYLGLGFNRLIAFDCDPGSLTTLAFDGDHVRLVTLNERPT